MLCYVQPTQAAHTILTCISVFSDSASPSTARQPLEIYKPYVQLIHPANTAKKYVILQFPALPDNPLRFTIPMLCSANSCSADHINM